MPPADVQRVLSRLANEPDFRALLAQHPEAALSSYDLSPEEHRLFRGGGAEALALLSWEARGQPRPSSSSSSSSSSTLQEEEGEGEGGMTPLPGVDLLLQVTPTLQRDEAGNEQIAHLVALHAAGQPAEGGALFALHLAPLAIRRPDGTQEVRYTASIQPLGAEADPDALPDTAVPTAPWGHDLTSDAVQEARQAVLSAASAEGRRAALADLIRAVTRSAPGRSEG